MPMLLIMNLLGMHNSINIQLFEIVHGLAGHSTFLDAFFVMVTSYMFLWLFCLLVLGHVAMHLRDNKAVSRKQALLRFVSIVATLLGTWMLVGLIKVAVALPRPFITLSDVAVLIQDPASWSFPSGHATMAFALATTILLLHRTEKVVDDRGLVLVLYIMACLVGFSRVYVGVHYPLDVLAGAVLGLLAPWLISLSIRWGTAFFVALSAKKD